jgi:FkbM family methyltransferase
LNTNIVKEGRKFQKKFKVGDTEYSHFFVEHSPPPNSLAPRQLKDADYLNASVAVFEDEEVTREKFYYPYLNTDKRKWVFDLGAQFGSYTLPALVAGYRVLAFSPETEVEGMKVNLRLNRLGDTDCLLIDNYGLYDRNGFYDTITNTFHETREHERFIDVITLDAFLGVTTWMNPGDLQPEDNVYYIKIDVEGAELPVLRGAKETIEKSVPYLLIENHLFQNRNIEAEIISYIDSLGLGYKHETVPYHAISHTFFNPNP